MIKNIIISFIFMSITFFSGCKETLESLTQEETNLKNKFFQITEDCLNGSYDKEKCAEEMQEFKEEVQNLNTRKRVMRALTK